MSKGRPQPWRAAVINLVVVVALLVAVSFLPPDTSLASRQAAGSLMLCVPPSYPPLVTGDADKPGYEVELGDAVAEALGLKLVVNVLPSIGKDFNPRNWFLTRAQCDMVGGGVADTVQTRSFMQTVPTAVRTGWIGISPSGAMPPAGSVVAVLPGTSGLNRVSLSSWLRGRQVRAQLVRSPAELSQMLRSGAAAAGVTERFVEGRLDLDPAAFPVFSLDEAQFPSYPMALGMWKGDQTLKRAVENAVRRLEQSGALANLQERYGMGPAEL